MKSARWLMTVLAVAAAAVLTGCSSIPIHYGGYIKLEPGETVKMAAPATSAAYAVKVTVGDEQVAALQKLTGDKAFNLGGPCWLMYNADVVNDSQTGADGKSRKVVIKEKK